MTALRLPSHRPPYCDGRGRCAGQRRLRRGRDLGASRGGGLNCSKRRYRFRLANPLTSSTISTDAQLNEELPAKGGALHANTDSGAIELHLRRTSFAHEHRPSRACMRARGRTRSPARHSIPSGQRNSHANILRDLRKFSLPFAGCEVRVPSVG
jgi:hypothetical protein